MGGGGGGGGGDEVEGERRGDKREGMGAWTINTAQLFHQLRPWGGGGGGRGLISDKTFLRGRV